MKQSFILGGFLGFALCFASALLAGSDADTALRDAVFCALIAAMLFRWLHGSCTTHLQDLLRQRENIAGSDDAGSSVPSAGPTTPAAV